MMAPPVSGIFSVPLMSNRANGTSKGVAPAMSTCWGSMPNTFGMPFGTSRCNTGHRWNTARTIKRGSGFTAWGWPTAASNGASYQLSEYA